MVGIVALVSRTYPLNEDTRSMLISLIVNVGMPCIILSSIFKVEIDEAMFRTILLAQLVAQIVIVQSMMPTLTMASVLFAKYSADENLGALTTITSTILALFSIPLVVYLLNVLLALKW